MKRKTIQHGTRISLLLIIALLIFYIFVPNSVTVDASKVQNLDLTFTSERFFVDEADYDNIMATIIVPYLEKHEQSGYLTTHDQAQLHYVQYLLPNSKGHITISHGFTEFAAKYQEAIYYFLDAGYSVSLLEHRNHGYSDRLVEDLSKVHINDFDTYIEDLKTFMDTIVVPTIGDTPSYLYAHSMGGGIGARFLETYPDYFEAAVLSSPMLEVATGGVPLPLTKFIANLACLLGQEEAYVFGHGPYTDAYDFDSAATTSNARYGYLYKQKLENPNYQTNGASFNWLKEALQATQIASTSSAQIDIPVLVFQAGKDTYVKPSGQNLFVNHAPKASLVYVEDAKHELYFERSEILEPYFNTVIHFYDSVLAES